MSISSRRQTIPGDESGTKSERFSRKAKQSDGRSPARIKKLVDGSGREEFEPLRSFEVALVDGGSPAGGGFIQ